MIPTTDASELKGVGFRCVHCGWRIDRLFMQYSPGNIRLMKCDNCKAVADPYIECEFMKNVGENIPVHTDLPQFNREGQLEPEPEAVLDRRIFRKGDKAGVQVLVQWKGTHREDATWEDREEMIQRYPNLADEVF